MSTLSLLICVAAVWLSQRLLGIWQTMRFRNQIMELREAGRVSVGLSKALGRRVYIAVAFDDQGLVTAALVLRGLTVFARGQAAPELVGSHVEDLAAGRTPAGLPALVARASVQAGEFALGTLSRGPVTQTSDSTR